MISQVRDSERPSVHRLVTGDEIDIACEIVPGETTWRASVVTDASDDWFKAKVVERLAPTTEYLFYYAEENVTWRRR